MKIILITFGVLVLTSIIIILIFKLLHRFSIKQRLKKIGEDALNETPDNIKLQKVENKFWKDNENVKQTIEFFLSKSFNLLGCYTLEDPPNIFLYILYCLNEGIIITVYESEISGSWVDMTCLYEDGTSLNLSNSTFGSALKDHPIHPVIYEPEYNVENLYTQLLALRDNKKIKNFNSEEIIIIYEKMFNEMTLWLKRRKLKAEDVKNYINNINIELDNELDVDLNS